MTITSLEELASHIPNFPLLASSKDYNYRINRAMAQVIIVRQFIYIKHDEEHGMGTKENKPKTIKT